MGQYYRPVLRTENEIKVYDSWDADNGSKLTEHSYIGNRFTESIVKELVNNPHHVAWVGDYADEEEDKEINQDATEMDLYIDKAWRHHEKHHALLELSPMENSIHLMLVNHTKKQYLDIEDYYLNSVPTSGWNKGMCLHPLPLLTAIGNGKGGGDYRGINKEKVGCWACDLIEVSVLKNYDYQNITNDIIFKE